MGGCLSCFDPWLPKRVIFTSLVLYLFFILCLILQISLQILLVHLLECIFSEPLGRRDCVNDDLLGLTLSRCGSSACYLSGSITRLANLRFCSPSF
jgi:hypothetical protein